MKKLVIAGAGGLAREVEWVIERINKVNKEWDFLGFIDEDVSKNKVIGNDEFVCNYKDELNVAIVIGDSNVRKKIYEKYKQNANIKFPNIIDPSVLISDSVELGEGNIIVGGNIITVDVFFGNGNFINMDCTIGHDAVLRNFVTLNPSVNLSGNTILNDCVNVGTGTQIIQGLEIGENTTVGAGAVVSKNLPANSVAVGIPAKVIKTK